MNSRRNALQSTVGWLFSWRAANAATKDDAPKSPTDSSTKFSLPGAGAVYRSVIDKLNETVSVGDFGASPGNSARRNTAAFVAAIAYCRSTFKSLYIPGYGYRLDETLDLAGVRVFGEANTQLSAAPTIISEVQSPRYAIALNSGCLENISVRCDAGNGIDASMCLRKLGLLEVTVETDPQVRRGSIGISFGSDATPGMQAITSTFQRVIARNFDVCFWARFYSNANVYIDFYALNTTSDGATQSSTGYKIEGRGGAWISPKCESNFIDAIHLTHRSYVNILMTPWVEGTNSNTIRVDGVSNHVVNPLYSANVVVQNANSRVIGRTGTSVPYDAFFGQGTNMIANSGFENGTQGWAHGSPAELVPLERIWGYQSLKLSSSPSGNVQTLTEIIEPKVLEKIANKPVTVLAVGQLSSAEYNASVRLLVNTGEGYVQVGTGENFAAGRPSISRVTFKMPPRLTGVQLRIYGSRNPGATPIVRFALPMLFVGADINDINPAFASDGANIFHGTQTVAGGGWSTAHLALGSHHLWIDGQGNLRIKRGVPTSDGDGVLVGEQKST